MWRPPNCESTTFAGNADAAGRQRRLASGASSEVVGAQADDDRVGASVEIGEVAGDGLALAASSRRPGARSASRFDMPMNSATYSVAGSSKTCSGVPTCSNAPARMIATRSAERERLALVVGHEHRA